MRDTASLIGLKVISSQEGREVGTISQVIVNLATGVMEGLIVSKGAVEKGIEAKDIQVLGEDAVLIPNSAAARLLADLPALMEKRRDPAAGPRPVLTDAGKRLGVLGAVYLEPATCRVAHFEVSGGALRDIVEGTLELRPMPGTVDGLDSVIVPSAAFSEAAGHPGGLRAQLSRLGEVARIQARHAAEGLDKSTEGLKRGALAVGEKATEAAAKVKEAGGVAATRVKQATERVVEKAKDVGETAVEKVKDAGEAAVEMAKEVGEEAVEKVKDAGEHAAEAVRRPRKHKAQAETAAAPAADMPAEQAPEPTETPSSEPTAE